MQPSTSDENIAPSGTQENRRRHLKMATLFVHHKVADYGKWRSVFDSVRGKRIAYGQTGERVLQSAASLNEIVTIVEFGSAEQARAWGSSAELKEAMKNAGVITQPEVLILETPTDAMSITSDVLAAIEGQDFVKARSLLSDDFQFVGATPQPLSAEQWLGVHQAFAAAMPDFSFHANVTRAGDDKAEGSVQVGGTHTGVLSLPIPGIPTIPPTGKAILNPVERIWVTAKDGKLTRYEIEHLSNGGVSGILAQVGATVPA